MPKENKNGKTTFTSEAESLFFVKHGVTGEWFKLARGNDQQIKTPGDNLRFYNDLKKVLQSNEILEVYRRRIARMLGGLLGLQPHALMIQLDRLEAVEKIKNQLQPQKVKNVEKNPKMPMAMIQFRQCVNLALELMSKHTHERDKERDVRRKRCDTATSDATSKYQSELN